MNNYKEMLKIFENEEMELQFSEFTSETALKIGLSLIERAKKENKNISIDIARNGHQLFHYSFDGTSPDNDQWMIKKNRVVNRFNKSSFHMATKLLDGNTTFEEEYKISSSEYAPAGGAFPIIIKNVGVVGTIAISGLTQEEDHEFAVWAIRKYLEK